MPEPWKWGFTPGERHALLLICAAVLFGVGYQAYQRQYSPQTAPLLPEDSLRLATIAAAAANSDSFSDPAPAGEPPPPEPLNINTATPSQLESLPGIGPALARRIVAVRDSLGGFKRSEDLLIVPGIGPKRLDRMRPWFVLSDGIPDP
jgi:competence ComEA-like helix-hairpin-helix protein